jgi:hypothetical protein
MTSATIPAIVNKRVIEWVDGLPTAGTRPVVTVEGVRELVRVAMSLEYVPDPDRIEDWEYEGMTNAEVMAIKLVRQAAKGDTAVISEVLDRVIGKPKQSIDSRTMTMTYQDYLEGLAKSEPGNSP